MKHEVLNHNDMGLGDLFNLSWDSTGCHQDPDPHQGSKVLTCSFTYSFTGSSVFWRKSNGFSFPAPLRQNEHKWF